MTTELHTDDALLETLLARERAALTRWCQGDPTGFLEISAPDVVYFDPFLDRRLDGWQALADYYAPLRSTIFAARFEILNPLVQASGDLAILTFNFVSYGAATTETGNADGSVLRWNCTEVYRRQPTEGQWLIIQTHWSFTHPSKNIV